MREKFYDELTMVSLSMHNKEMFYIIKLCVCLHDAMVVHLFENGDDPEFKQNCWSDRIFFIAFLNVPLSQSRSRTTR